MRFDKFTIKAQEAVVRAQELAQQRNHAEILPLHLLAALSWDPQIRCTSPLDPHP